MNSSPTDAAADAAPKEPVLVALGERVRLLRARRGMTRRDLAHQSNVSERHLANLEMGSGNASLLVLAQLAQTLGCSVAALVGDPLSCSAEGEQILECCAISHRLRCSTRSKHSGSRSPPVPRTLAAIGGLH